MTWTLTCGDGIAGLLAQPAASIDLIVTDPPSGATQAHFDKAPDLIALRKAMLHALKPNGAAVVMASNLRFAAALLQVNLDWFRYDLIWAKSRPTGFLNARKQPLRAHEHICVFYRAQPPFHPQKTSGHAPMHSARQSSLGANYGAPGAPSTVGGETDRMPTSVLPIGCIANNAHDKIHAQQKPVDLFTWLIRSYADAGALVADPFSGSGVCALAARNTDCRFIGWELDEGHWAQAHARLTQEWR